jgi:vacuolar-type H+-ATPase subunit E/Vma4
MSKKNKNENSQAPDDEGKQKLIQGIEDEAKAEAATVIEAAEKAKADRLALKETQVKQVIADAEKKAAEQVRAIERNAASLITVDSKRLSLRVRERIISAILERLQEKMAALIGTKEYTAMLRNWIVEAIIGLGVSSGSINASTAERKLITDDLLRSAIGDVEKFTGRKTIYTLFPGDPLIAQGITATSEDGRTAFNNQVHTRILRHQSEIRKLIYDELFQE